MRAEMLKASDFTIATPAYHLMPRSQLKNEPSQARKKSRRHEEPDDDDRDRQEGVGEEDSDSPGPGTEITRKANDLVRLALFTEHRRSSLKRDEITKKGAFD